MHDNIIITFAAMRHEHPRPARNHLRTISRTYMNSIAAHIEYQAGSNTSPESRDCRYSPHSFLLILRAKLPVVIQVRRYTRHSGEAADHAAHRDE